MDSEEEEDSSGSTFGQRQPPLSVTIKGILERYPHGQIFKEIIQNADDAGAQTVHFYLDSRQHRTHSLVYHALERFQGPALLAYNDAQFTSTDWKNIQKLQCSEKAKDPFKVGRFGIGFNSVYHITDLPTIISGEKLAYLEPQEKVWPGETGKWYDITSKKCHTDTFAPFEDICGFSSRSGSYAGTLFRFPLRDTPSGLSETTYTIDDLRKLLEALRKEAKFLLLFLRSVNTINIIEISENGVHTTVFEVAIHAQEKQKICQLRMEFQQKVKLAHDKMGYSMPQMPIVMDFHVSVTDSRQHHTESHWLVASQVGSENRSVSSAAQKQRVLPWVGVALELNSSASVNAGRAFCFLPMPEEASPPLPVHVNSTFGLTDDRRAIKWPCTERMDDDPAAKWNTLLVNRLLPPCYAHLLSAAKQYDLAPEKFYKAWPKVQAVEGTPWEGMLQPLLSLLFSKEVFWSERSDTMERTGEWVTPSQGFFIPEGEELPPAVHSALSSCGIKLVEIPSEIWGTLTCSKREVRQVTPKFTRSMLRNNLGIYKHLEYHNKLELLEYCLLDRAFSDLQGLELLPLANGMFLHFKPSYVVSQNCYVCSDEFPPELLPNLNKLLVDLPNNRDLQSTLQEVASSQKTQLQRLDVQSVARLLPQCFPPEWSKKNAISISASSSSFPIHWFETFWNWVKSHSLKHFLGQLVVPVDGDDSEEDEQQSITAVRLTQVEDSPIVHYVPEECSDELYNALSKVEVYLTSSEQFPYLQHNRLFSYLNKLTPNGVLTAIANAHLDKLVNIQYISLTDDEAHSLQALLATHLLGDYEKHEVLMNLPIFTALNHDRLYSVAEASAPHSGECRGKAILEPKGFNISLAHLPPDLIVLSRTHNQISVLNSIGQIYSPNRAQFLLHALLPMIKQNVYPEHLLDSLMEEVLQLLPVLKQHFKSYAWKLVTEVGDLPFVKTSSGTRKKPCSLFDPSISDLKDLFQGEPVFPVSPFDEPHCLSCLNECGLRKDVQTQEIVSIIESISIEPSSRETTTPQGASKVTFSRAKAVLKYLNTHSFHPKKEKVAITSRPLQWVYIEDALVILTKERAWLPIQCAPPKDYPKCLSWKGRGCICHLSTANNCVLIPSDEDRECCLPEIVGSQMYIVDSSVSSELSKFLSTGSPTEHVVIHFQAIINQRKSIQTNKMDQIVRMIYNHLEHSISHSSAESLKLQSLPAWIWIRHQHTFVSPKVVALEPNSNFHHTLEPFLYIIPSDLSRYSKLFTKFGIEKNLTQSQILSALGMIKEQSTALGPHKAWVMVWSILDWLTSNGEKPVHLSDEEGEMLYVPVESDSEYPELVKAGEVVYTDNDFLKHYLVSSDSEENYIFVHHCIRPKMAHHLGLTPLSQHLEISEDTFEDVGQHEPLTTRLRNILQDYKDRVTIIKELLQNGDDAGASVVNICYDSRTHGVPQKHLIYSGMAECHGPALVVHNDASFSDEDFKNITKLAAGTKQDEPLKIGKFGIGFCSVYHITDVPSFVSRDFLYIFDPNLKFLRQEIKNPARPGKKLRFTDKIVASSKQLVPYANLYDFNPKKPYNGTTFRLPFRTSPSDISHNIYNEDTIQGLLADVTKCGPELLLFLRHVKKITFSRIDPEDKTPKLLLSITKEDGAVTLSTDSRCLSQMCTTTLNSKAQVHKQHWLVYSHSDTIMFRESEKYATASVACLLESSGKPHSVYTPKCVEGEVFCFLPLAVRTGLPVHVSSNFAVMKDRTGIKSSDDTESSDESQWNVFLMQKVIPVAYHMLIMALQQMCAEGKIRPETYQFFSLWPLKHSLKSHNPWDDLIEPLYQLISSDNSKLFYSPYTTEWIPMKQCKFLVPTILCKSHRESTPKCVLEVVEYLDLPVVNLLSSYQQHLPEETLLECTISEEGFVQLFFENIDTLEDCKTTRNEVLLHLLEMFTIATAEQKDYLKHHLSNSKCVPCTPDGNQLKECSKVIDKWSLFAGLYDPNDGIFPIRKFYANKLVHSSLQQLGMITKSLPWKMLADRARSVQLLHSRDRPKALKRTKLIIECIEKNLAAQNSETVDPSLAEIPFLPVMQKPSDYPLKWYGQDSDLLSGRELFRAIPNKSVFLVGSQTPFVSEAEPERGGCGFIPTSVQTCLQLQSFPTVETVLKQLCQMTDIVKESRHKSRPSAIEHLSVWMTKGSHLVYEFLESKLSSSHLTTEELHQLQHIPCVWTGSEFVSPAVVAVNWEHNGPYLFSVPQSLKQKRNLMAALGIQTDFLAEDFLIVLQQMHSDFGARIVRNPKYRTIVHVWVQQLAEAREIPEGITCYLPDTSFTMHKAEELAYNDAPWCKVEEEWKYVHESIPRDAALKLGVKPVRSKFLERYESSIHHFEGVEFGQKERLTQRIKNILREYPFDVTVMKELLQNADDAKATKMYIILDKRTHGTKQLPSNEWKDLQGPALLVWNDSIFTEDDLSGIQRLGLGNKRSDAESIGLYGIGFNVVYHLTDCPSFITNGSTFCVLDPHCRYVPGANELTPGRRYDSLDEKFWSNWKDLRSTYLQDTLSGCPSELKGGTLFRIPLRSTRELVQQSEIVDESWVSSGQSSLMYAWKMQEKLKEWAPDMEKALLFLNHITELKFFIITEPRTETRMQLTHCFQVVMDTHAKASRTLLHDKVKAFKETKGEPHIVHYALTVIEKKYQTESKQWLIQQGIGDVDYPDQHWRYSQQVKPRHGLAAPLEGHGSIRLRGSVFCFLSLPIVSNLPVHVNGSFILNAARSNLWSSEESDDRTKWNEKLIEAIASSYARFLVTARDVYVIKRVGSKQQLQKDIQRYYDVFPVWLEHNRTQPEGLFKDLAKQVYVKLSEQNAEVLAMIQPTRHTRVSTPEDCVVEWHPLHNDSHLSKQAFFWEPITQKETALLPIFEKIGMHITAAPYKIWKHFEDIGTQLPKISRFSVFEYYSNYFNQVSKGHDFPCPIQNSAFQSVANFKKLTKYLVRKCENTPHFQFPKSPFGIPLLLTADGQLRKFEEQNKVLNSAFASLFPESAGMFLHPELLEMKYESTYFLEPSVHNWDRINGILSSLLPPSLCAERVENVNEYIIMTPTLKLLWDCLACDSVFLHHRHQIVGKWALLPSTDNHLFSVKSQCQLLPIIPPGPEEEHFKQVFEILKLLKMPVLNTHLVQTAIQCCHEFCPVLSKPNLVLISLFFFLHEKGVLFPLSSDLDSKIAILFDYFGKIHFRADPTSLQRIKSLPLFRNIDGELCSLQGNTVYVWPSSVCQDGCDKWVKEFRAVFLERGGVWTKLGPAEVLGVQEISPLTVYMQYIFPHFSLFTDKQRLNHLQHIRDNLFDDAKSDSKLKKRRFIALQFISALEKLPCLPQDGSLKPISEFVDHRVKLFTTFPESFHFLPVELRSKEWLKFLSDIGLCTKVAQDKFIQFCRQVSSGSHRGDLARASSVLLGYLFKAKEWYAKEAFLGGVSQIPFVCPQTLPALSWIKPPYPAENRIQQGQRITDMTKLSGAVLYKHCYLVWTVRSVVDLPTLPYLVPPNTSEAFYDALGIVRSPSIEDIIQNIKNISQTRFSSFSLFDKYPEECKYSDSSEIRSCLLVEVMKANFEFIKDCTSSESTLKQLCDIPCVPVCAQGQTRNIRCPVLVKPLQVIANTDEVEGFRPFLNPIPDNLYNVLPGVLSVIGVGQSIHLQNIRVALETIHASVTPPLDPNTQTVVKRLLKKLYHILQSSMEKTTEILASLKPLHLPTAELTLVDSTVLFYCDKTQYKKARPPIDLTNTPCTLFSLLNLETGFNEKKFCELLPTEIRPCPLSSYCDEVQRYSVAQECSSLAKRLAYSFSLGHDFAEVTYALLRQSNPNEEKLCSRFAESLNKFLQTTEVVTVRNLVVDIMLNLTEPKQKIGTAKVDFLLEKNDNSFVLYLDEEANPFRLHSLIESLVATVAEMSGISSSELTELEKAISHPLEAENPEELLRILEDMDVPDIRALEFQSVAFNPSLKPKCGEPIPESWHHRLDPDINNIFRPGEWVGYEEREDHIIFALVGYRIQQDGQNPEDIQLEDQYLIYTREDDEEEGKTVSVIDLYKIIRTLGRQHTEDNDLSLAIPDTESVPAKLRLTLNEGDLKSIKRKICEQLRNIWKLPEDQRRKAIKRLYLKWHPDKNDHYLATKAFQFLQRQIARLHAGLPLEDPDSEEEEGPPMPPWTHPWDGVARRRGRARQREQNFWNTHGSSGLSGHSGTFGSAFQMPRPEPQTASVWIKQAEADLEALKTLLGHVQVDSDRKLCSHVCFLAHEIAEKALKAGMYAACGLHPGNLKHHNLSGLAGALEQERRQLTFGLRNYVSAIENYYLKTRFPNTYSPPQVPADQYTPMQAREAKSIAEIIFDMMKTVVGA